MFNTQFHNTCHSLWLLVYNTVPAVNDEYSIFVFLIRYYYLSVDTHQTVAFLLRHRTSILWIHWCCLGWIARNIKSSVYDEYSIYLCPLNDVIIFVLIHIKQLPSFWDWSIILQKSYDTPVFTPKLIQLDQSQMPQNLIRGALCRIASDLSVGNSWIN